jgi:hypothetical protein
MDFGASINIFFSSPESKTLKEKELLRSITEKVPPGSPMFYDLTFHATFAKRIFDIIRREGPHTLGFDRMQQSFTESVEKVRQILLRFEAENLIKTTELTSATKEARTKLSRLIEDLAQLKNWLVSHEAM